MDTVQPSKPTAPALLKKFLEENKIELRLTPLAQVFTDGGIIIRPPQILADFIPEPEEKTSIAVN